MTHPLVELLTTRRSVKPLLMTAGGPSEDEIATILTVASRTPDHGKLVPWRFIVFNGAARERAGEVIADTYKADHPGADAETLAFERNRLARAPLVIAVVSRARPHAKIPEWEQVLSAGAVCMNLTLAANALGYGTNWLTEWYGYDRRVLDAFGLAPHERVAGFLHIGRSDAPMQDRDRPQLADVVTYA
ncbi:MAG: nitroreductase [Beijerinckiaceae bacterium]|jgi:nitroreductase|nr:nitroreductase [Beijerinckiaceae bacterium]